MINFYKEKCILTIYRFKKNDKNAAVAHIGKI